MKSNWEILKSRSAYHFDTRAWHLDWDTVHHLGQLVPNWQQELNQVLQQAQPVTWRTRGRPNDSLQRANEEHDQEDYDLEQQGYGSKHVVSDLTYEIPQVFKAIADQFELTNAMVRIHVQRPGQVWNLHLDKLEKWMPQDPTQVARYFVQLTDWQQGHFWSYGNFQWAGWQAGDVSTFDWWNVPHATANAGHVPRATLQITGVKTQATQVFLEKLKHEYLTMHLP